MRFTVFRANLRSEILLLAGGKWQAAGGLIAGKLTDGWWTDCWRWVASQLPAVIASKLIGGKLVSGD